MFRAAMTNAMKKANATSARGATRSPIFRRSAVNITNGNTANDS